jgi:hypothetical protein
MMKLKTARLIDALRGAILESSENKDDFVEACKEWRLASRYINRSPDRDSWERCICGHAIRDVVRILNTVNGKELVVGKHCIDRFKFIPSKLFASLRRVERNPDRSVTDSTLNYFYVHDHITDDVYDFYMDVKRHPLKSLNEKQLQRKHEINAELIEIAKKVLDYESMEDKIPRLTRPHKRGKPKNFDTYPVVKLFERDDPDYAFEVFNKYVSDGGVRIFFELYDPTMFVGMNMLNFAYNSRWITEREYDFYESLWLNNINALPGESAKIIRGLSKKVMQLKMDVNRKINHRLAHAGTKEENLLS